MHTDLNHPQRHTSLSHRISHRFSDAPNDSTSDFFSHRFFNAPEDCTPSSLSVHVEYAQHHRTDARKVALAILMQRENRQVSNARSSRSLISHQKVIVQPMGPGLKNTEKVLNVPLDGGVLDISPHHTPAPCRILQVRVPPAPRKPGCRTIRRHPASAIVRQHPTTAEATVYRRVTTRKAPPQTSVTPPPGTPTSHRPSDLTVTIVGSPSGRPSCLESQDLSSKRGTLAPKTHLPTEDWRQMRDAVQSQTRSINADQANTNLIQAQIIADAVKQAFKSRPVAATPVRQFTSISTSSEIESLRLAGNNRVARPSPSPMHLLSPCLQTRRGSSTEHLLSVHLPPPLDRVRQRSWGPVSGAAILPMCRRVSFPMAW